MEHAAVRYEGINKLWGFHNKGEETVFICLKICFKELLICMLFYGSQWIFE